MATRHLDPQSTAISSSGHLEPDAAFLHRDHCDGVAQEDRASTEQSTLHAVSGIQCRDAASARTSFVFEDDLTHVEGNASAAGEAAVSINSLLTGNVIVAVVPHRSVIDRGSDGP